MFATVEQICFKYTDINTEYKHKTKSARKQLLYIIHEQGTYSSDDAVLM